MASSFPSKFAEREQSPSASTLIHQSKFGFLLGAWLPVKGNPVPLCLRRLPFHLHPAPCLPVQSPLRQLLATLSQGGVCKIVDTIPCWVNIQKTFSRHLAQEIRLPSSAPWGNLLLLGESLSGRNPKRLTRWFKLLCLSRTGARGLQKPYENGQQGESALLAARFLSLEFQDKHHGVASSSESGVKEPLMRNFRESCMPQELAQVPPFFVFLPTPELRGLDRPGACPVAAAARSGSEGLPDGSSSARSGGGTLKRRGGGNMRHAHDSCFVSLSWSRVSADPTPPHQRASTIQGKHLTRYHLYRSWV